MASIDNENSDTKVHRDHEDESYKPRLCFVLCTRQEPGPLAHANDVARRIFGPHYEAEVDEANGQVSVIHGGNLVGILQHVGAPVPGGEAEDNAVGNILWKNGPKEVATHRSHVIVVVFRSEELEPIESATVLTRLAMMALELFDGFAVYWGAAPVTNSREVFELFAQSLADDLLPVQIWLKYSAERNPDGSFNLYTWGMGQFDLWDLELHRCRMDLADALDFAWSVAEYLLSEGPILKDGDTIGRSADERFPIQHAMSITPPRRPVYRIICDPDVQATDSKAAR